MLNSADFGSSTTRNQLVLALTCKQIIKNDLLLDNAAMFTVCNTVSRDHREMYGLFGGQSLFQGFNSVSEFALFVLADHVFTTGELHFTKVYHVVGPVDKKVYLGTLIFFITFNAPSRQG